MQTPLHCQANSISFLSLPSPSFLPTLRRFYMSFCNLPQLPLIQYGGWKRAHKFICPLAISGLNHWKSLKMAVVDSSKMRNWQVRDAVAEDIPDILQMIKVHATSTTKTSCCLFYNKVKLISWYNLCHLAEHKLLMLSYVVLCLVGWGNILII